MYSSLKQIQPYIPRVVIKEEKMWFIYYYTFSMVFLFYILKVALFSEAARNGHIDIVRLLIENGADVSKVWVL